MYLYIDTADKISEIALLDSVFKILDKKIWHGAQNQSEELLKKIDEFFHVHNYTKEDLCGVFVNKGPGSYTGLRVGISTANALAYALGISVWAVDKNQIDKSGRLKIISKTANNYVSPKYLKPPHITKSNRGHNY